MKKIVFPCLFTLCLSMQQSQAQYSLDGDLIISHALAVYTTPTSVLNPYGAMLPLGLTYYINEPFSISADVSVPLGFASLQWLGGNYRYKAIRSDVRLRADIKWYFRSMPARRYFFGLEAMYRSQHFTMKRTELYYSTLWYGVSNLDAHKTVAGGAAFFGGEFQLRPHLLLEGTAGFGMRTISMQHNFDPASQMGSGREMFLHPFIPPGEDNIGDSRNTLYLPLSLSIKYLLH